MRGRYSLCIVTKGDGRDKHTLRDAECLVQSGLAVAVIGRASSNIPSEEERDGIHFYRTSTVLAITRKILEFGSKTRIFSSLTKKLSVLTRFFDRAIISLRHLRRAYKTPAEGYHAYISFGLIAMTWFIARLKRVRYFSDYNDAVIWFSRDDDWRKRGIDSSSKGTTQSYYEQGEMWGRELTDRDRDRIQVIRSVIPSDVENILDVGCGDGHVTNELIDRWRVTGVDSSQEALRHVKTDTVLGSIERLPFPDNSFDLVLSSETLEHLPKKIYRSALTELRRVSRKYLLIEVPHCQQLAIGIERCIICDLKFHANFHYRSFRQYNMNGLFGKRARILRYETCGIEQPYYHPLLLWIKKYVGGRWAKSPYAICPRCGSRQNTTGLFEINAVTRWCNILNKRICERRELPKSQVCVLYEIKQSTT